jgi:putative endonuclease
MEEVIGSTPIFSTKTEFFNRSFFMASFVYILFSEKCDKYYVGCTDNLERRLLEHNSKSGHLTSRCSPWKQIYLESYESRGEALKREKEIKARKSRKYIELLLKS